MEKSNSTVCLPHPLPCDVSSRLNDDYIPFFQFQKSSHLGENYCIPKTARPARLQILPLGKTLRKWSSDNICFSVQQEARLLFVFLFRTPLSFQEDTYIHVALESSQLC